MLRRRPWLAIVLTILLVWTTVPVLAQTLVIVTPLNPQGWAPIDVRADSSVFISTTQPRSGLGSLEFLTIFTTPGEDKAEFAWFWQTSSNVIDFPNRRLDTLTALAYEYYRASAGTTVANDLHPWLKIYWYFDPNTPADTSDDSFGSLIYEEAYQEWVAATPIPEDVWISRTIDLTQADFWMYCSLCNTGGPTTGVVQNYDTTIPEWLAGGITGLPGDPIPPDFSTGTVYLLGISVGVGSGWNGDVSMFVDNVRIAFGANDDWLFNFEPDSIQGTVYLDTVGDGQITGDPGASNVRVLLFEDDGDNLPSATDGFITSTLTDANGQYALPVPGAGTYWVVVDSRSGDLTDPTDTAWAEQTYGPQGAWCANPDGLLGVGDPYERTAPGPCFGGRRGAVSDDVPAAPASLDETTGARFEHLARVTITTGSVSGIDFGFSFRVVTNVQDQDDDPATNRTCQGCFRQFILNANTWPGGDTMRFVPAVSPNMGAGSTQWWQISITSSLPVVIDANTVLDGRAYSYADGQSFRDANAGSFIAPFSAGTGPDGRPNTGDEYTLPPFEFPELELDGANLYRLTIQGSGSGVQYIAFYRSAIHLDGDNTWAADNFVGLHADASQGVPTSAWFGIHVSAQNNTIVRHNVVSVNNSGIRFQGTGDNFLAEENVVFRPDAGHSTTYDGILIIGGGNNHVIRRNVIFDMEGAALEVGWLDVALVNLQIVENTLMANGFLEDGVTPSTENVGVVFRRFGAGSSVQFANNVVESNAGPGVGVQSSAFAVTFSQNSFRDNAGPAIDLEADDADPNANSAGDGVTPNNGTYDLLGNQGMDYPVFTFVARTATDLYVEGFVGTSTSTTWDGQSLTLEFYQADNVPADQDGEIVAGDGLAVPHGEGAVYLGNCTVTVGPQGAFSCTIPLPSGVLGPVDDITAIATDPNGNTSEFGPNQLVAQADLSLTKSAPASVIAGTTLTYTFTVTNLGPGNAINITVQDTLPVDVTYQSDTCGGSISGGVWTWTIDRLTAGASVTCDLTVSVNASATGTLNNSATVFSDTPDPDNTNNAASTSVTVNAEADISITKTAAPDPVVAGTNLTYTITVTNNGPSDAQNVVVQDTLPPEVTYQSDTCGGTFSGGVFTWNVGTLLAGAFQSCTVEVLVSPSATGTVDNTVQVSSTTFDPNNANNTVVITTSVTTEADLLVVKSATPDPAVAGAALTYTITVTNNGPSDAQNVVVQDTLPPEVTYQSDTCGGTFSGGVFTWNVGTLSAGGIVSCDINVIVSTTAGASLTNQVDVTSTTNDPNAATNTYTLVTGVVTEADLRITKVASPSPAVAGDPLTYTITVVNNGPSNADGVVVQDTLPGNVTYQSNTCGGTFAGGVFTWNVGTVLAGGSVSCDIQVVVNPDATGTLDNVAEVSATTTDPDTTNNRITVTTGVTALADLSLNKTAAPDPVVAGTNLTYTITVTNNGPSDAQNVQVQDALPANVTYQSDTCGGGVSGGVWTWNLGLLPAGDSRNCQVTVLVNPDATGTLVNNAIVTSDTPETNLDNDTASVSVTVNTESDVSVSKSASPDPAFAGDPLTYTITVTNNGPSDAQNVVVQDTLPLEVTYQSDTCGGTFSGGVFTWNVGTLPAGSTVNCQIIVNVDPTTATPLENTVQVSTSTSDPDSANNTATLTTNIAQVVDLELAKTVDNATPYVGTQVTFTLTLTNTVGNYTATNIEVTDQLPAGFIYVSHTAALGTYDPNTGVWSIPALPPGASTTLTIVAQVNSTGPYTNAAEVTAVTPADKDSTPGDGMGDDYAEVTVSPQAAADLEVTMTVNNDRPVPNEIITVTVQVTNVAPSSTAPNVLLRAFFGDGFEYVSHSVTQGSVTVTAGSVILDWTVGDLAELASATLQVQLRVKVYPKRWQAFAEVIDMGVVDRDSVPGDGQGDDYAEVLIRPILPETGFAPGRVTVLPPQPADLTYAPLDMVISIPKLGVETTIVGVPTGRWNAVQWLGDRVGYIQTSTFPTWRGNSVLAGHNYLPTGLPGPFYNLEQLVWGDVIRIQYLGTVYEYEVRRVVRVDETALWPFAQPEAGTWITLITCEGVYDPEEGFSQRVVVQAVLMRTYPAR